MTEAVHEAYERLRPRFKPKDLLPDLAPTTVSCVAPESLDHDQLLERLEHQDLEGWIACQSALHVVQGTYTHRAEDGRILSADLALDEHCSWQVRHVGGGSIVLTEIREGEPDGEPVLAQDLQYELLEGRAHQAGKNRLRYRRYWSFTDDGRAVARLSRLVGFAEVT